jgi:hypothetical protein
LSAVCQNILLLTKATPILLLSLRMSFKSGNYVPRTPPLLKKCLDPLFGSSY